MVEDNGSQLNICTLIIFCGNDRRAEHMNQAYTVICIRIGSSITSLLFGLFTSQMDDGTPPEPDGTFVDYQTTMVKFSKAIAITAQEMVRTLTQKSSTFAHIFSHCITAFASVI